MNFINRKPQTLDRILAGLTMFSLVFSLSFGTTGSYVAEATTQVSEACEDPNDEEVRVEDGVPCPETSKIDICHAAGPNNYVPISPSKTADVQGHAGGSHQDGMDIIPPFNIDGGGTFPGQNWDAEGMAIYNEGACDGVYDVCTNIDGVQTILPDGMEFDDGGECVAPIDVCPNLDGTQTKVPEEMIKNDAGNCVVPEGDDEEEEEEVINSCLVPSTEGDTAPFEIGSSGEVSLATILSNYGFGFLDINSDQKNYQTWALSDPTADMVTFDVTVLAKVAGNKEAFIYYKAGDETTFVPVFQVDGHSNGSPEATEGDVFSVSIPAEFADSIGFAVDSEGWNAETWHSEFDLNASDKDNVAVYNPSSNTYIVAFEDQLDDDNDYNDLVVKIDKVTCVVEEEEEEVENTCLIPSAQGDDKVLVIYTSGETSLQDILDDEGYGVHVTDDQENFQVWDFSSPTSDSVTFTVKVIAKNAGNSETFGYYTAGDTTTFVPVFTIPPSAVGNTFSVTVDSSVASSLGFAIETEPALPDTLYTESALNNDGKDSVAVYNPTSNTYVLAFEDLTVNSDNDYNDLVVEITGVTCFEDDENTEDITMCKIDDDTDLPVSGWSLYLTDGIGGEPTMYTTLADGCVTASVNPDKGPWTVTEDTDQYTELVTVTFTGEGGYLYEDDSENRLGCIFFQKFALTDFAFMSLREAILPEERSCTFVNKFTESDDSSSIQTLGGPLLNRSSSRTITDDDTPSELEEVNMPDGAVEGAQTTKVPEVLGATTGAGGTSPSPIETMPRVELVALFTSVTARRKVKGNEL